MTEPLHARAKRLADEYAGCATTIPLQHAKRTELHAAIDEMQAEIDRAAQDAARLDWLQARWSMNLHVEVYAEAFGGDGYRPAATVFVGSQEHRADNVRAAIDAAMKEQPHG